MSVCSLSPRPEGGDSISIFGSEDEPKDIFDNCLLGKLPLELRQEIYKYVIGQKVNCLALLPFKIRAFPGDHALARHDVDESVLNAYRNQCWVARSSIFWPHRTAILRTCRRIYRETIELLYQSNIFLIKHHEILFTFIRCIRPQRVDSIRNLKVSFLPPHCKPQHFVIVSERFWNVVVGMKGLKVLCLRIHHEIWPEIDYPDIVKGNAPGGYSRRILAPLLELRGLSDITINLSISFPKRKDLLPLTEDTKELIQRIERVAKLPRKAP
ncbi:MAG: hypothetical protein Q9174_002887 [Haloplaca sp. 1 TL-2023]